MGFTKQFVHRRYCGLTPRQLQVVRLMWEGLTSREIAERLGVSLQTVEVHRFAMMRIWEVTNAAQVIRKGLEEGVIRVRPSTRRRST